MTATFDCPHCGAPLSFEPHPGDKTVECSFCHETVIIPEELQIPLPAVFVNKLPSPARSRRLNLAVIAIAIIGIVTVCIILSFITNSSSQSTADLPTETTSFDTSNVTTTVEARATLAALQPILKLQQSWPISFTEKFVDNSHEWKTGDVRDGYITGNRSIGNGTYTWNVTAVQSASDFSFPTMPDQTDFYASVDMKYIKIPDDPDADAGMVFRYNSNDQTWYYFSVNDKGQYYFGWYDGKNWHTLIPETDSTASRPGQTNQLAVGAQGSQFIFLINGQMVDHFIDENLKSGTIGVGINLPQTGEKVTVEFSNFSVLSSSPKP